MTFATRINATTDWPRGSGGTGFSGEISVQGNTVESSLYPQRATAAAWVQGAEAAIEMLLAHPALVISGGVDEAIDRGVDQLTGAVKEVLRRAVRR
jgi:hypothetical protein